MTHAHQWMTVLALASAGCIATSGVARAATADDYRGGWETGSADPHIYEFSIRGDKVRGIYCTYCDDATTLAFVDGTLGTDGLHLVVAHVRDDGSTVYQDQVSARLEGRELLVTGHTGAPGAADGGRIHWNMHKDPRSPAPLVFVPVTWLPRGRPPVQPLRPSGRLPASRPYVAPGPWERLTPAKVQGVWLGFGAGIDKQFFIIRRVGTGLRGMVCGRCNNPWTMAALDNFQIDGDTLHFDIQHEDWGDGNIPFYKHVTAHIADNEMRAMFQQDHPPPEDLHRPQGANVGASLMGPVAIGATRGNR